MRPQSILNYPRFHALCVQFAESDRQETLIFVTAYEDLRANDRSDDAQLIRCAFWYHQIHLTKRLGESAKKHLAAFPDEKLRFLKHATLKHALSTRRIYTFHFAQAIFRLRRGQSADYKRQLGIAMKIIVASGVFRGLVIPEPSPKRKIPKPRKVPREIIWPEELSEKHRLNKGLPQFEEMGAGKWTMNRLAVRAVSIVMVNAWQRLCSMWRVELQHIICGTQSLDVIVPDSKGRRLMMRMPLSLLAPLEEVRFLRDFKIFASDHALSNARLTDLAGFGHVDKFGLNAPRAYRAAFKVLDRTHDPRRCGMSFAPLRAMVCRNHDLLDHPYFPKRLIKHQWFTVEALDRFRKLVPADQTDAVEVLRRIAGWSAFGQLFTTYCRTWHIQLGLCMPDNSPRAPQA